MHSTMKLKKKIITTVFVLQQILSWHLTFIKLCGIYIRLLV